MGSKSKMWGALTGGGIGAFVSVILIWVLKDYAGVVMPPEVQAAVTGLITALLGAGGAHQAPKNDP